MRWTSWDSRCALRAAGIAVATLGLAWVVTAASDEGGLPWGERAGRALPFAPVCAAVGAWLALASGRARGEDIALASIGRSPFERHAAAIAGGAGVALAAALALAAVPAVDVRGFFPRADARATWRWDGAAFASTDGAWRIERDGAPTALASVPRAEPAPVAPLVPRAGRMSAAVATALLGVALPMLAARARRRTAARDALAVAATAFATVLAFQAAAASRAPAPIAAVPAVFLLAAAVTLYRLKPWLRAKSPK